jgi:Tol biopolymer transport system component
MLRRTICAAALATLCFSCLAQADTIRVMDEPRQLTPEGQYFMQPIWSPQGDRLAVAGENYEGLWEVDRQSGQLRQISDQIGAGFLPVWSADGQRIATRVTEVQDQRRFSAITVLDVDGETATELTEYEKDLSTPHWIDGDRKLFFTRDGKAEVMEAPGAVKSEMPSGDLILFLKDGAMVLRQWPDEEEQILQPVEGTILWAILSPDKGHIVFEVSGAELYSVAVDGTGLVELGRGERPRWSPDGRWITCMVTEDDGYRILSADIFVVSSDGGQRVPITETADRLEMNPDWSPDGGMIACDTRGEGAILLIPVETERDYPPER